MLNLKDEFIITAIMACFLFLSAACSSVGDAAAPPAEDIQTETQKVVEATIIATETPTPVPPIPLPTPTPTSGSTELKTEIIEPVSPDSPVAMPQGSEMNVTPSTQIIPGSEEPLAAAIADLSKQNSIPSDQIQLISMEAVDWNDASLGCPQPGFMYAQVITPGYKIILEAQGQQYEYHTDQTTNVIWCQQ